MIPLMEAEDKGLAATEYWKIAADAGMVKMLL